MISKIKIIGAAVAAIATFSAGWQAASWRLESEMSRVAERNAKLATRAVENRRVAEMLIMDAIILQEQLAAERSKKLDAIEKEVIKDVIEYAQSPDGAGSCLSPEWLQLHDEAAKPGADQATSPGA